MTDEKQRNDELDERPQVTDAAEDGDDTEGHMFLSDVNAAREIARARNADAERAVRERRLEKEARPNRQR